MISRRPLVSALVAATLLAAAVATVALVPSGAASAAASQFPPLSEAYRLAETWDGSRGQGAPGSLLYPAGIEIAGSTVYIADRGNHRLQAFAPDGAFLNAWGQLGSGPGDLSWPQDVAVDGSRIYVTDRGNGRVAVFDLQGTPLGPWRIPDLADPWGIAAHRGRVYVTRPKAGEVVVLAGGAEVARWRGLAEPRGIEVGSDGIVYVAEFGASAVSFYTAEGTPTGRLQTAMAPLDVAVDQYGDLYVQSEGAILWYPAGATSSKLAMYFVPFEGVTVSSRHGVFATAASDVLQFHGVKQYPWRPRDGRAIGEWSLLAYPPGRLHEPRAIHAGPAGRLWLLDGWPRLQAMDPSGRPVEQLRLPAQRVNEVLARRAVDVVVRQNGEVVAGEPLFLHRLLPNGTLSGTLRLVDNGERVWLTAMAQPRDENQVLVLDSAHMHVRRYGVTTTLRPLDSWPLAGTTSPAQWEYYADLVFALSTDGPTSDRLYAVNRSKRRIEIYQGRQLTATWEVEGIPARAALGPGGELFVLTADGIVWKYSAAGQRVAGWDAGAYSAGASEVADIAVDGQGRVYTVDRLAETVRVWELDPSATPEPPHSRGIGCRLRGDKRAAPGSLRLGQTVEVRLEVGGECPHTAPQADIILAIDRSYSMNEDSKITSTIQAAIQFIGAVDLSKDRIGIVTFSNTARLDQPLTGDRAALEAALGNIAAVGGTEIDLALAEATRELTGPHARPDAVPVLILLTDGIDDEPDQVLEAAFGAKERGIRIFTIGFGKVDPMVMVLSATSPEHYYYAPDTSRLADIYAEIARRLIATVLARQMKVVDQVPANMRYLVDSARPAASWDPGARTLTWQLTDIPFAGLTLSYRLRPTTLGRHPTNLDAQASFTDGLGQQGTLRFPIPMVEVLAAEPTPTSTSTPFPTATATPRPPKPLFLPLVLAQRCRDIEVRADVALVIDTSGSMNQPSREGGVSKLAAAKKAARAFVEQLELPHDRAAVISFNLEARLVQPLTGDLDLLLAALEGLETQPGTRIDRGLEQALAELTSERARRNQNRVIVLLTDGRSSVENQVVLEVAGRCRQERLLLFTIGLGTAQDVDFDLLRQVASRPEWFYEAPSAEDLERIYDEIAFTLICPNLDWP